MTENFGSSSLGIGNAPAQCLELWAPRFAGQCGARLCNPALQLRADKFRYSAKFRVVDLGLRIGDIDGLDTEQVPVRSPDKTKATLRRHGASEEEIAFLLQRRVELDAFPSDELIAWSERKLTENGVGKILPDSDTLADAYRRMRRQARTQEIIDQTIAEMDDMAVPVPEKLRSRLAVEQEAAPDRSWDAVLRGIAEHDHRMASS